MVVLLQIRFLLSTLSLFPLSLLFHFLVWCWCCSLLLWGFRVVFGIFPPCLFAVLYLPFFFLIPSPISLWVFFLHFFLHSQMTVVIACNSWPLRYYLCGPCCLSLGLSVCSVGWHAGVLGQELSLVPSAVPGAVASYSRLILKHRCNKYDWKISYLNLSRRTETPSGDSL